MNKQPEIKPNKLLGQNFLVDKTVLAKIIEAAQLSKEDTILEIGPGLGILTEELAKHAGRVFAIEKDEKLVEILKEKFQKNKNIEIISGDALKFESFKLKIKNYKVVANIPYYLTAHLIRTFLESSNPPQAMTLMVQKEVARRICARPPEMSLLAVATQFYATAKIQAGVSRKSFRPQPKVDSAIIKITPYPFLRQNQSKIFFKVVRAGFSQPRKQLINNLSRGLKIDRAKIAETLKKIGLQPEQRAETLSVEDWKNLSKFFTI